MTNIRRLCGIDEAGRGPLAGPLIVAGVVLDAKIAGLRDSKKLTQKRREDLYEKIVASCTYHIASATAQDIDNFGISYCLAKALRQIQHALPWCDYLFDGNTTFNVENIRTMIKADTKIDAVSAASILAKVTRDKEMVELSKTYNNYGFELHKGYGSSLHIEAIKKHGYCAIHRKSFKIKALQG